MKPLRVHEHKEGYLRKTNNKHTIGIIVTDDTVGV